MCIRDRYNIFVPQETLQLNVSDNSIVHSSLRKFLDTRQCTLKWWIHFLRSCSLPIQLLPTFLEPVLQNIHPLLCTGNDGLSILYHCCFIIGCMQGNKNGLVPNWRISSHAKYCSISMDYCACGLLYKWNQLFMNISCDCQIISMYIFYFIIGAFCIEFVMGNSCLLYTSHTYIYILN